MDDLLTALQNDQTERIVEIRDKCVDEIIRKTIYRGGDTSKCNFRYDAFAEGNHVTESIRDILLSEIRPPNKKVLVIRYVYFID